MSNEVSMYRWITLACIWFAPLYAILKIDNILFIFVSSIGATALFWYFFIDKPEEDNIQPQRQDIIPPAFNVQKPVWEQSQQDYNNKQYLPPRRF